MTANRMLIGLDVGGTFTDAVVLDANGSSVLMAFKLLSTPADPGAAVITALQRVADEIGVRGALVCHGTTVGTNTLIQRKGAKVGLLATSGFSDVIELRRQNRPTLYDLTARVSEPLVPRDLRFGITERMNAEGQVVTPLTGMTQAIERLRSAGVESVAIAFLHSYANSAHEQAMCRAVEQELPGVFVTASSDVCPEFREFERTSTAVVNAYIGPAVGRYIRGIAKQAAQMGVDDLMIVKSNGGLTSPDNAARYPAHLIESGPAAGMIATAAYARTTDRKNVIAFDMGGTTAKAGVVQNFKPRVTDEFLADQLVNGRDVGGYPIRSAVLDIIEIGAGGGSIAWIDAGGVLKVGPESAGAYPGPACYSRGGQLPTVTDAHAVIGTLSEETFEGTGVSFSRRLAIDTIETHIAKPMGWSVARAAHSILELAVASMTEMVRLATVRRGLDPRDFSILASGGAGPLHAAWVGAEVGAKEVVIPPLPGMFSALGAVLGEVRHDLSQTLLGAVSGLSPTLIAEAFARLKQKAEALLANEPQGAGAPEFTRFADLRFTGQLFELRTGLGCSNEAIPSLAEIERRFRALYVSEFGFDLAESVVQLVNLHLVASLPMGGSTTRIFSNEIGLGASAQPYRVQTYLRRDGTEEPLPVYRTADCIGAELQGPLLIEHSGATVWIHEGQTARIGADGSVAFQIQGVVK
jgi:N-methylhydantoinase A